MAVSTHTAIERKALAAFYTPSNISTALCDWAVRSQSDRVLEPSFGACVFLVGAAAALRKRGAARPFAQLYGCDIDHAAFVHLRRAFPNRVFARRFVQGDFLAMEPGVRGLEQVDAIVGNPPYISNHNMNLRQRTAVGQATTLGPLNVRRTASLWAHFLNHSLRFLRPRGRVAMLLPGAAFRTDYGQELTPQLAQGFRRVDVIQLNERVFAKQGVREMPTVLLCDDWTKGSAGARPTVHTVEDTEQCWRLLKEMRRECMPVGQQEDPRLGEALALFRLLGGRILGDIADIRIGIVTGANHFFVLSPSDCETHGIPSGAWQALLGNASQAPGLAFGARDVRAAERRDERCRLLRPGTGLGEPRVKAYLASYPKTERARNRTFAKRDHWQCPVEGEVADGFLPCMNGGGPRLILNTAGVQVVNNIHRVYFKPGVGLEQRRLASLTLCSTLGQIAGELLGRRYSGGVLKLEPSDGARLPVASLEKVEGAAIAITFAAADRCARNGDWLGAREAADRLVLASLPKPARAAALSTASALLTELRQRRRGRSAR